MDYKEKVIALLDSKELSQEQKEKLESIFPELKESEDERIRKELISFVENWKVYNPNSPFVDYPIYTSDKKKIDNILAWLEEQGEQNPADKVEPKFEVDDWVIVHNKDAYQVIKVNTHDYRLKHFLGGEMNYPFTQEYSLRLWTIKDAKPGDVLVASDDSIFIFASVVDCFCKHYVAFTTDDIIITNKGLEYYWDISTAVHPATKEQRDQLEKAMFDAGYKWNKVELKLEKI